MKRSLRAMIFFSDQPKRGLPRGQVNAHPTSGGIENNGEFLRARRM